MKSNRKKRRPLSWQRITLSILAGFLALVLCVMIGVTVYAQHLFNLINRPGDPQANCPPDSGFPEETEYTFPPDFTGPTVDPSDIHLDTIPDDPIKINNVVNIMLIGEDRRPDQHFNNRSDAMILCTFNKEKKTITMTSFMRDLYVQIPGRSKNKLNSAYAGRGGGMSLLTETIAINFGVHVDACVHVDFAGFTKVIDTVGGVDISLTAAEVKYMHERDASWHLNVGMNHLNGAQALEYARIRRIGNDFGRTERQRKVLSSLLDASRNMSWSEVLNTIEKVLPLVTTDMTNAEIIRYASQLYPLLGSGRLSTLRIPADGAYSDATIPKIGMVLVPNLQKNRQILINTISGK